jgi:hypothetical protein
LVVTDGGAPAVTQFRVDSTTGDTVIAGDLGVGLGFSKFTVAANSGNTNIAGTLTTENTLTINGSTIVGQQFFTITDGGAGGNPARTTLQVDTATGNLTMNGGNINIFGTDGTTPRLTFNNSSGDFATYGSFSALGDGTSTFGGNIDVTGDTIIRGGDLTVYTTSAVSGLPRNAPENNRAVGDVIFSVSDNGSVNIAGMTNYFSSTGGRKWEYSAESVINGESNVNYFLNVSGNTVFKLPSGAQMGDMIRIIDIGGVLKYDLSLVVRAPNLVGVQGSTSNTGVSLLGGVPTNQYLTTHSGGELIVQTPNAGFALVYAGTSTPDGLPGAPASKSGWYIVEV